MTMDKQNRETRPACVSMEVAAAIFGWPNYYLPFLVRAGHLKPLGKPAQKARKWFAIVEIERLSQDPDWLVGRTSRRPTEAGKRGEQGRADHPGRAQTVEVGQNDLSQRPKSDPAKLSIAARLRRETTLTLPRIAARLEMGSWKSLNTKLHRWRKINESHENRSRL